MRFHTFVLRYRNSTHGRKGRITSGGVLNMYQIDYGIGSDRSFSLIRDLSFTTMSSRNLSTTTVSSKNSSGIENKIIPADSFLLEMLLTHSHWKKGKGKGEALIKSFELRDVRTSERFENMVRDFLLKLEKNKSKQVVSLQIDRLVGSAIVNVTVKTLQEKKEESGLGKKLSQEEISTTTSSTMTTNEIVSQDSIEAAMAVDTIAAELQLGGNPNWS